MKRIFFRFAVLVVATALVCTGCPPDAGAEQAAFIGLIANGGASATTTILTLTFDKDITGLTETDITLTEGNTGTTRGVLTKAAGTGVYNLTVSDIIEGGQVTVTVSRDGYAFNPNYKNVNVHFKTDSGIDIGIGDPSIKLYLDGSPLQDGGSSPITQGEGTYTVSIPSGTYTDIIWYVNGNVAAQGAARTSVVMSKQTVGTYQVTVEATPSGGGKNSGSHSFVVQ